ncbi:MAG TPA: hypothetical protein VGG17_00210 [Acidimicrobiales bacterium]
MDRPFVAAGSNGLLALLFKVQRETGQPLLVPGPNGDVQSSDGNGVKGAIPLAEHFEDHETRLGVVGGRVCIAEGDLVVVTEIGELPSALTPFVIVPVQDKDIDNGSDVAPFRQRR